MDSPIRKQQKRNDYLRHKLFRKINRRKKAEKEQALKAPEKELKRRLKRPRYDDGKEELIELPEVRVDEEGNVVADDGRRGTIRLENVVIKPDHNVRDAVDRYFDKLSRRSERAWYTNPITGESYMPKGGPLESVYPEFDLITLGQIGTPLVKAAGNYIWYSPDAVAQYIRYPIGKMKYGFDAKFPTLYRKFKGGVVQPTEDAIQLTNPDSRFAFYGKTAKGGYSGQQSPDITNMSYGNSVRSHGQGNWDSGYTLAFPGEELVGKRVISTEPSDLFTYGSRVSPKTKDVTLISGDPSELKLAEQYGMQTATSPELQGAYDTAINGTRNAKFTTSGGRTLSLVKEDYSEYAKEMRKLERQLFGDIRQKDVDFMNFVLRPEIEGKLYDKSVLSSVKEMPDDVGEWVGSSSRRGYLYDEDEFGRLIYDPLSPVESRWRDRIGINLKSRLPQWQRELYHSDPYGYNSGKNSGIHINPKNRGKFNALKKRTGKTTEQLTHSKNPLTRKRAIFAQNSKKWRKK